MKKLIPFLLVLIAAAAQGQGKNEKQLVAQTYRLSHTVFGTRDSLAIEELFAKKLSYGHSGGRVETRAEAIAGIIRNKSVYSDTAVSNVKVILGDDVGIVRHLFTAKETNSEGKVSQLNFNIMLVWVKENGKWKLMGRQSVRLP